MNSGQGWCEVAEALALGFFGFVGGLVGVGGFWYGLGKARGVGPSTGSGQAGGLRGGGGISNTELINNEYRREGSPSARDF